MKGILGKYLWQFLLLYFLQTLVFGRLELGLDGMPSFILLIYPLAILILPMRVAKELCLVIGFVLGFLVDLWYQTPGVHAASLTLTAFLRPYVYSLLLDDAEIRHNMNMDRMDLKLSSYIAYMLLMYFIHCLVFFLLQDFTFERFGVALVRSIFSTIFSFIFAFIYRLIILSR